MRAWLTRTVHAGVSLDTAAFYIASVTELMVTLSAATEHQITQNQMNRLSSDDLFSKNLFIREHNLLIRL